MEQPSLQEFKKQFAHWKPWDAAKLVVEEEQPSLQEFKKQFAHWKPWDAANLVVEEKKNYEFIGERFYDKYKNLLEVLLK